MVEVESDTIWGYFLKESTPDCSSAIDEWGIRKYYLYKNQVRRVHDEPDNPSLGQAFVSSKRQTGKRSLSTDIFQRYIDQVNYYNNLYK
jgi:hypothetical protein